MTPSIALDRRAATMAFLAFVVTAYQAWRVLILAPGRLDPFPFVTTAPMWARYGYHAAIMSTCLAACIVGAARAIRSLELHITPRLTVAQARSSVVGPRLAKWLPPAPTGAFTVRLNRLDDWRWWGLGAGLFVVSALPYWLLIWAVGHIAAVGPLYVAARIAHHLPPWALALVALGGLAAAIWRRRTRTARPAAVDKPALLLLAFVAGSEGWSTSQRWRVCLLYSLWLQGRGVFPLLTLLTAIPSQRLILALYRKEIQAGRAADAALSHVLTVRTARIAAALAFYAAVAVVKFGPLIW